MNPDNYGSLEACKKLEEVLAKRGIVVKTKDYWHIPQNDETPFVDSPICFEGCEIIPAFSMAEVWRKLPKNATLTKGYDNWAFIDIGISPRIDSATHSINPADALIELWIWVLAQENK